MQQSHGMRLWRMRHAAPRPSCAAADVHRVARAAAAGRWGRRSDSQGCEQGHEQGHEQRTSRS